MIMNENIQKLKEWVQESDNIVFFGGAGVSTESGIPDFRSGTIRLRRSSVIPSLTVIRMSITGFIGKSL